MFANIYTCVRPLSMTEASALTFPSRSPGPWPLSAPLKFLYIIHRNCYTSEGDPESSFPCCLRPGGWLHMYEMVMDHFANQNLSIFVAKLRFLRIVVWDRTSMWSVFITTLTKMTRFLIVWHGINGCHSGWGSEDVCASFLFVGDLNGEEGVAGAEWLFVFLVFY